MQATITDTAWGTTSEPELVTVCDRCDEPLVLVMIGNIPVWSHNGPSDHDEQPVRRFN